jgi:hypothetical protein
MSVEVFDFKSTNIVVNGKYLTGFMDGTVIQTEKNEDNKDIFELLKETLKDKVKDVKPSNR